MAFVIDRSLYLSPEVVVEPRRSAPLEVKVDPFSLEALVAWLERQDGATEYNYCAPDACLIHQYFNAVGVPCRAVGGSEYADMEWRDHDLPPLLKHVSKSDGDRAWTFGAALSRARKLLAEREK